jgi:hypothetical protein
MHLRIWSMIVLTSALFALAACNKSNPVIPTKVAQCASFLDKGAVVPRPDITLVIVNQDSMSLLSTRDSSTLDSWSSAVSMQDFSHLASIINDNNLMGAPDPVLPPGAAGCVGARGMSVVLIKEDAIDTLDISGLVWCLGNRSYWPAGLEWLVAFKDSLVNKYRPMAQITS